MIKGLTPRLCEIGKIKIGGKGSERTAKNGRKYRIPVKYNHFVITKTMRDAKGILIPDNALMKKIGEKPKEIRIRLMFDDIDLNFQTSYAVYKGKKCYCRGDGETALRLNEKSGEKIEQKCDPTKCKILIDGHCKVSGILSCLLPQADRLGGVYKFRTHSINSVLNILGSLHFLKMATGGVLFNLPLKLELIDKQTEEHGIIKCVNIIFDGDVNKLTKEVTTELTRRKIGNVDVKRIETEAAKSGILTDNDQPGDVEDEFYYDGPEEIEPAGSGPEEVTEKLQQSEPENEGEDFDGESLF
jgi:hypothetical protein